MPPITAPTPDAATTTNTDEPDVVLHRMDRVDILNAQVYGIPAVAICGFKFVPQSGSAPSAGSGDGKTVLCESCDILWKCGFTPPRATTDPHLQQ
ncbi:hypothetical protein BJF77_11020 [Kocuria sp. CNJ-770]|uniref:hypothetical protein n=1 Tax=Kocuria sp. CNJ-770 TaxID=1904964 RepID=UPI0009590AF2|nr:hypothetical protein [Kocuria sp. CNJ-770]OLT09311.1 hypothetical protein BJF77_11020 [Kocuria sp. CNJ-770]